MFLLYLRVKGGQSLILGIIFGCRGLSLGDLNIGFGHLTYVYE